MHTLLGEVDATALQELQTVTEIGSAAEDYHAVVTAHEFCLKTCGGTAHVTGIPDAPGLFCKDHIRRDVAVRVLKTPSQDIVTQLLT